MAFRHDLGHILYENQFEDYFQLLFQCSIASEIVYQVDAKKSLQSDEFKYFNHGINSICVSQTIDDYPLHGTLGLEAKYAVCDCSTEKYKRIVVACRGTQTMDDFLVDLKLIGEINKCQGRFHSGIFRRSETIPIDYFLQKLLTENYQIVFTGHSLGAAIAALLTVKLLLHRAITSDNIRNIQFIGFGCPLIACSDFKSFIEKSLFYNNFHFYVNEDDMVPKLLAILSNVIYKKEEIQESNKVFENCKTFLNLLLTVPQILDGNKSAILYQALSVVPTCLKAFGKSIVPNYQPFGRWLNITTKTEPVPGVVNQDAFVTYVNVSCIDLMTEDRINTRTQSDFNYELNEIVDKFQNHFMENYFNKLKPFFEKFVPNMKTRPGAIISTKTNLNIPDKWNHVQELSKLVLPASYHIRMVLNESHCDIFVTLCCDNSEYLMNALLKYYNFDILPKNMEKDSDCDGILFTFSVSNEKLIRNGQLITKSLNFNLILISHFNTVEIKIPFNGELEKGFSFREEKISTIPNDLLYFYAACYIYTLQKMGSALSDSLAYRCDQLLNLLGEIDKIWNIAGSFHQYKNEELENALKKYFTDDLEATNDDKGYNPVLMAISNNFNVNFSSKYVYLKDCVNNAKNTNELFRDLLPTVHHLNKLQSQILEIRSISKKEKLIWTGGFLTFSLIPGVNVITTILSVAGVSSLGVSFYKFMYLYRLSQSYYQGYLSALKFFMEAFEINQNSCLPYLHTYEKMVCKGFNDRNLFEKTDDQLLDEWNQIFKKSDFLTNVDVNSRKPLLKILKSIQINCQIRDLLTKDYFIGVVGKKKCGKSTFIETLLPGVDAHADSKIATMEITPYQVVDSVIIFDFPHFESIEYGHKLQFVFSRFILDYLFFVCDAKERTDSTDTTNFLNLIKTSCGNRFLVLLNQADLYWRETKTFTNSYATCDELKQLRLEVSKKIGAKLEDDRVLLSCLNQNSLQINERESLNKTEIYTAEKLRDKVIDILIEQIPKSMNKRELRTLLNEKKTNQVTRIEKMIEIKKKGKKSSLRIHIILNGDKCEKQTDHIDVRNINELKEEIQSEFDIENAKITREENNETIETIEDLLFKDFYTFIVS